MTAGAFDNTTEMQPGSRTGVARRRRWFKPVMLWLHRWIGLTLGIYFVVMGLSGSALVYRESVDVWLNPHLHTPAQSTSVATVDEVLEAAAPGEMRDEVIRVLPPRDFHPTWEVWVGAWGADMEQVYVDPATAEVLGKRELAGSIMGWLQWLHYTLLLADPGFLANGVAGLVVTGLLLTGLVLWWPKTMRQSWIRLTVKASSLRRFMLDIHNASGAWSLPLLLLITLTGVVFPFYTLVMPAMQAVFGGEDPAPAPTVELADGETLTTLQPAWETAMAEAEARDLQPSRLTLPREKSATIMVRLEPAGRFDAGNRLDLTIDARDGTIVHRLDSADTSGGTWVMYQMFPLHAGHLGLGQWWGELMRALWALSGLIPLILFISGLWLWWKKRRPARSSA